MEPKLLTEMTPELIIIIIVVMSILALIPTSIAHRKGYNFIRIWIINALIFNAIVFFICATTLTFTTGKIIIVITMILSILSTLLLNGMKKCPQCAEKVKREAKICRFCNYQFPVSEEEKKR